ncbi:MAG: SigB/SigF/SigG family RNA polymerase sigma factor [Actinomycetota bacterium]|nr:SigB/SigF/SigG family RNA polymerase sigma factor [Actinomycetota bacterium]
MHESTEADDEWLDDAFRRLAETRDDALRDEIVERTNWLAVRGARRFASRGEPFDDLLQVARMGLLKAVDRFDRSVGVHFGAYATPTILGELRRYFRDHTWSVHVPRRAKDLRPAVNEATDQLSKELGRSPQVHEIAQHLHITDDAVLEAMEANSAYRSYSLDPQGVGRSVPTTKNEFDGIVDREVVIGLLDRLPARERKILYLRFFEELSQSQIAEQIGTSQVHVGRLISSSLASLRSALDEPIASA